MEERKYKSGFTLIELVVVMAIATLLAAMAIPIVSTSLSYYRLNGAVESAELAIQSAHYQAIMHGYPYQVAFTAANNSYQLSSEPGGTVTFSATTDEIPLSASPVVIGEAPTLFCNPNGSVIATSGSLTFTISYSGYTKTITVSNYGSISVQ